MTQGRTVSAFRVVASLHLWIAAGAAAQAPPAPPAAWVPLIGEYGRDSSHAALVLERDGKLILRRDSSEVGLVSLGSNRFRYGDSIAVFSRLARGHAGTLALGSRTLPRRALGPDEGAVFRIRPVRPVAQLRREALAAQPPAEPRPMRAGDLVELVTLDSTIKLDIRYAGSRNFLGTPLYSSARAFLQRPAAEALVRAHRKLAERGLGLLIHDGYRPWYVTRMFWDATPVAQHEFVADPATGSRHNRGCAVDLTLYDLRTGRPIEMPGTYDEFSHRSYPGYPGGTSRQRWYRALLRGAMEAEGFTVFSSEWWHFDYKDWREYPIGNRRFEEIE